MVESVFDDLLRRCEATAYFRLHRKPRSGCDGFLSWIFVYRDLKWGLARKDDLEWKILSNPGYRLGFRLAKLYLAYGETGSQTKEGLHHL